ncbi:YihY/virulence factor BrkB family protein [Mangrovivirga sp. M17]|uniref:YihY/virulence factor BrkB family protein n=1 Tax=Mangrovivirga halotolerans TaxID=2993936 RepID=A0ABT3RN92_9BACT|nr:YihY/virulence factor BrkB family protein [Mangrovivirga halotolerans]MCX2743070.1 YihY/virulence factor BrkB family protein [Mangrovivirga halotolerans]
MAKKFKLKDIFKLLKLTYQEWMKDDAFAKAAAVAYYAVFALPGFLLLILYFTGLFIDEETITGEITTQISNMIGPKAAKTIETILMKSKLQDQSFSGAAISIGSLLFGATGLFFQLQKSLNSIWEVEKKPDAGIKRMLLDRATSLGIIIIVGVLMLISLVLSATISILSDWLSDTFGSDLMFLTVSGEFILSLFILTLLFAAIFKVLPDVEIRWKTVWTGAIITALLFSFGKWLIAVYISNVNPDSNFGAGGAIILFLLWVSYSCLIIFFGAEFTQVFAENYGYKFKPSEHAQRTAEYRLKHHEKYEEINIVQKDQK